MPAKDSVERLALLLPAGTLARLEKVADWYGLDRQDYARTVVVKAMVEGESTVNNARSKVNDMTPFSRQSDCRVCGQRNTVSRKSLNGKETEGHDCPDCGVYFIEQSLVEKLEANNMRLVGPEQGGDWASKLAGRLPIASVGPVRRWLREMRIAGEYIPLITEDGLTIATGSTFEVTMSKRPQLEPDIDTTKRGEVTIEWSHASFFERLAYVGAHWFELLDKLAGGNAR